MACIQSSIHTYISNDYSNSKQERNARQMNCDADQFQCKVGDCKYSDNDNCNGPCIQSSWVNDGEADCTDGSDEGEYFDKKQRC